MDKKTNSPAPVGRFYRDMKLPDASNLPPRLIQGMVTAGETVLLVADSSLGKTWLGFQLAVCFSLGLPFLGQKTRRRKVVYVDMELSEADEAIRAHAVARHFGHEDSDLPILFINGDKLTERLTSQDFEDRIKQYVEGARWECRDLVIIVDTLGELLSAANIDENDASQMGNVVSSLRKFARDTSSLLLATHHTNKRGNQYRGSSAIRGGFDNIWSLGWVGETVPGQKQSKGKKGGKPVVVLKDEKHRSGLSFGNFKLDKILIPRERPLVDDFDVGEEWDGFVWDWVGIAAPGSLDWNAEINGDDATAPTDVAPPNEDENEKAVVQNARMVPLAFQERTNTFPSRRNLAHACARKFGGGPRNWGYAVSCALDDLKLLRNTKHGNLRSPLALTPAGAKIWEQAFSTATRPSASDVAGGDAPA